MDRCKSCDEKFNTYSHPKIIIKYNETNNVIYITITGHLKLKKLYIFEEYGTESKLNSLNCVSNYNENERSPYIHKFGYNLGTYSLISSVQEEERWILNLHSTGIVPQRFVQICIITDKKQNRPLTLWRNRFINIIIGNMHTYCTFKNDTYRQTRKYNIR